MDTTKVFEALPHVTEIWVTADGNFHLHPHYGGEKVSRGTFEEKKEVVKKATTKNKQNG